ncbi:hypothetical protein [Pseudoflavonifractor phocaeensis]|uniref:hypothetical protein n=1 Tax=Pseudoflavonifractor phocaeensis TaxID=1870988 RepID=UPI00195903D6|nr:hypothetical protein [Pseudoflavonifractor phocaeensis]MBM6927367.1 hypothetical protein [Pseudoflavonifractor phocaeensis]
MRSAIGYSPPQTTTDNFLRIGGDTRKNIPFHISTDSFGQKLGTCSEKISLSLYNGHFIRRLAGKAGIKFPSRKVPPNLQRTIFYGLGEVSPKKSFHFTTDIFSEKNRGLPEKSENKMLPALEKAEASCSADMRFERTASTAAVRTQRRNERSGLSASLLIGSCWEHPNPY